MVIVVIVVVVVVVVVVLSNYLITDNYLISNLLAGERNGENMAKTKSFVNVASVCVCMFDSSGKGRKEQQPIRGCK